MWPINWTSNVVCLFASLFLFFSIFFLSQELDNFSSLTSGSSCIRIGNVICCFAQFALFTWNSQIRTHGWSLSCSLCVRVFVHWYAFFASICHYVSFSFISLVRFVVSLLCLTVWLWVCVHVFIDNELNSNIHKSNTTLYRHTPYTSSPIHTPSRAEIHLTKKKSYNGCCCRCWYRYYYIETHTHVHLRIKT